MLTDDAGLIERRCGSLRNHGAGVDKYDNVRIGLNSRLDTIQAAILIEKLSVFADEIMARNAVAARYAEGLKGSPARTPTVIEGGVSTWAQYTIEHPNRDGLAAHLKEQGIPTAMYYPRPTHAQTAYAGFPVAGNGLPTTMDKAGKVIALPMHPYLTPEVRDPDHRGDPRVLTVAGWRWSASSPPAPPPTWPTSAGCSRPMPTSWPSTSNTRPSAPNSPACPASTPAEEGELLLARDGEEGRSAASRCGRCRPKAGAR